MSSDFVYNSEYNNVMSGGYSVGSSLFKDNLEMSNINKYNSNLAVPIGTLNYRGGAEKVEYFETHMDNSQAGGIDSTMIGGSTLDGLLKQMDPSYKQQKKIANKKSKKKNYAFGSGKRTSKKKINKH